MATGMILALYNSHVHWSGVMQWWAMQFTHVRSLLPCERIFLLMVLIAWQ